MEAEDIFSQISKLSERQREVLGLVCQGMDYKTIAQECGIDKPTVKTHMQAVYLRLGLKRFKKREERLGIIREIYCPLLQDKRLPPPQPMADIPDPIPDEIKQMVDEDERALVVWEPKPLSFRPKAVAPASSHAIIEYPQPTKKPSRVGLWLVIGMILGAGIMLGLGRFLAGETKSNLPSATAAVYVTQVSLVITATPLPTEPTATSMMVVVTATPKPATATPRPTNTSEVPTDTPQPSTTSTLAEGTISFQDDFEDGLDSQWRILSGEAIVTDGKLGTAGDSVTVEIGDKSWSNYTVDFDFINNFCPSIRLIVAQQLRYGFCIGEWEVFKSNDWDSIADGPTPPNTGHLRLMVSGSSYTIFINGVQFFDIKYGQPQSGPFAIMVGDSASFVDNVVITSP